MTSSDTADPSDTEGTSGAMGSSSSGLGSDSSSGGSQTGSSDSSGSSGSGSESSSGSDSSSSTGLGDGAIGEDCVQDNDCMTGVCWDFADYDALCSGAVCSIACVGDDDCVEAFEEAGATSPDSSVCGGDGRCNPIGTGFGAFLCA